MPLQEFQPKSKLCPKCHGRIFTCEDWEKPRFDESTACLCEVWRNDIKYPEEEKMDHIRRQAHHKFPELKPNRINLDAVAHAAGFRRGLI